MSEDRLEGQAAVELLLKGKEAWNRQMREQPFSVIDFSGLNFEEILQKSDLPALICEGFEFPEGELLFRGVRFGDKDVSFDGARLQGGTVDFSGAEFGDSDLYFNKVTAGKTVFDFSDTRFLGTVPCEVHFDNGQFEGGEIRFDRTLFRDRLISLEETDFRETDLGFRQCRFEESSLFLSASRFDGGSLRIEETVFENGDLDLQEAIFNEVAPSFTNTAIRYGEFRKDGLQSVHPISLEGLDLSKADGSKS